MTRHKYIKHQFSFEDTPHYLHLYKRHWWSKWKLEMNGVTPAIYKFKNGNLVEIL